MTSASPVLKMRCGGGHFGNAMWCGVYGGSRLLDGEPQVEGMRTTGLPAACFCQMQGNPGFCFSHLSPSDYLKSPQSCWKPVPATLSTIRIMHVQTVTMIRCYQLALKTRQKEIWGSFVGDIRSVTFSATSESSCT